MSSSQSRYNPHQLVLLVNALDVIGSYLGPTFKRSSHFFITKVLFSSFFFTTLNLFPHLLNLLTGMLLFLRFSRNSGLIKRHYHLNTPADGDYPLSWLVWDLFIPPGPNSEHSVGSGCIMPMDSKISPQGVFFRVSGGVSLRLIQDQLPWNQCLSNGIEIFFSSVTFSGSWHQEL